ncbi:hypothetical protein DRE_01387 [Drechslerella stenobrocha 248]|uniref:Transcription regulator Rua1 C-terminal domain-containing protein n=1 Tax=Drechslerella stenobrocha 248 TaxID=1043628 RepID=W7I5M7_9PEZI|nr:hypothetical protein DRE_01387 [Drechslerella stenobrocha 248]
MDDSTYSIYDRTSSNSPFDANATLRGLPSKSYLDIHQQAGDENQWQAGPSSHVQHHHRVSSKPSILNQSNNAFAGPAPVWQSSCYQTRAGAAPSMGQPQSQSYDVGFWPVSQDGIIVRGVDPEPLSNDFPSTDDLDAQTVYLHPKFSYPQPVSDCDSQSLTTSMSRRLSDASTSISADVLPYDGIVSQENTNPASLPYNDHLNSLGTAPSSCISTANPSPLPSPRNVADLVRVPSRGKVQQSPRQNSRLAPYCMDGRTKRWSTGMNLPSNHLSNHVPSIASTLELASAVNGENGILQPLTEFPGHCDSEPYMYSPYGHSGFQAARASALLPSQPCLESQMDHHHHYPTAQFHYLRMLQSNADPHYHYGDASDRPDLYAALSEEQLDPPEEDMNPEDPDMKPHEQELRFEGDLYTPKWVRNHGNKREGWCGICKPGRWLVLKNSAFWYDKSFTHGISAATGQAFMEPQDVRRVDGNPDVWEGLCHSCNDWISLVSNKKKGTTWFRHAYKCHVHQAPKIKGTPKRRIRDSRPGTARSSESV